MSGEQFSDAGVDPVFETACGSCYAKGGNAGGKMSEQGLCWPVASLGAGRRVEAGSGCTTSVVVLVASWCCRFVRG